MEFIYSCSPNNLLCQIFLSIIFIINNSLHYSGLCHPPKVDNAQVRQKYGLRISSDREALRKALPDVHRGRGAEFGQGIEGIFQSI